MTSTSAPHPDDARCAQLIIDDLRVMSSDAMRKMIGNMISTYPTLDPRVALITLTHCDLTDEGDEEVIIPPLTPFALMIALTDLATLIDI